MTTTEAISILSDATQRNKRTNVFDLAYDLLKAIDKGDEHMVVWKAAKLYANSDPLTDTYEAARHLLKTYAERI
jgi:hypothetical protein